MEIGTIPPCALFTNIATGELPALLSCLGAAQRTYLKGSYLFSVGEKATHMGILLSGHIDVLQNDFWGNENIYARLTAGDLFGESILCAQLDRFPVNAVAAETCTVLLIDFGKVFSTCGAACAYHSQMISNMVKILAEKNIALTQKMQHLTQRTTRQKLLSYLSQEALWRDSNDFTIPFSRQKLADFLSVDRSALCRELSLMRREGLLQYDKNRFVLRK